MACPVVISEILTSKAGEERKGHTDPYALKIYKYVAEVREPNFLEFRHLQRINLSEQQNELAREKSLFAASESVSSSELLHLRETLRAYSIY